MRLAELKPEWLTSSVPDSRVGVVFDCPCGNHDEEHRCHILFANPIGAEPFKEYPMWQRTGDTLETLTLTPSIFRSRGCGWHGFITNGEVRTV